MKGIFDIRSVPERMKRKLKKQIIKMKVIDKLRDSISSFYEKMTNADLSLKNRAYDFYLLFGEKDESKSPWLQSNWNSNFKPCFDDLINHAEAKEIGIRVNKYKIEKRISQKDNKEFNYHSEIKLGRLKWEDKSHDKWTIEDSSENYFERFELWSPIWTICEKRQVPPEIFISISNERNFDDSRDIQFGYFIVVAIAKSLNLETKSILRELAVKVNAKAAVLKKRRWGMPEKEQKWTFKNGIQDSFSNGIYKEQDLHIQNFEALEFEPAWEIIYQQK